LWQKKKKKEKKVRPMFLVLVDGEKSYAGRRFLILLNSFFLELQDTDAITCDYLRQH
jgi:hypothetical protein